MNIYSGRRKRAAGNKPDPPRRTVSHLSGLQRKVNPAPLCCSSARIFALSSNLTSPLNPCARKFSSASWNASRKEQFTPDQQIEFRPARLGGVVAGQVQLQTTNRLFKTGRTGHRIQMNEEIVVFMNVLGVFDDGTFVDVRHHDLQDFIKNAACTTGEEMVTGARLFRFERFCRDR